MKSAGQLDKEIDAYIAGPYLEEADHRVMAALGITDLEGVIVIDSRKLAYVAAEAAGFAPGTVRLLTERKLGDGVKRWYFRRVGV